MVSWNEIRGWRPSDVSSIAESANRTSAALCTTVEAITRSMDELDWTGDAAEAARAALRVQCDSVLDKAAELQSIARCLTGAAASMYPVAAMVRDGERDADEHSFQITDDGRVRDPVPVYSTATDDAWEYSRDRLRSRRELAERIAETVRRASEIDDETERRLSASERPGTAIDPVSCRPPEHATAPANAAFWDSLTSAQRTALLVHDPAAIGNLDGIPADVRDAANRHVLASERARLNEVERELAADLESSPFGGVFSNADAGLAQTRDRLAALDAIAATLERGNRQLLVLDNDSADETLAAVAVGDVRAATHVAVFVPGLGSDVAGDLIRYDEDMESLNNTVQQLLPRGQTSACVTWTDYQAPQLGWSLLDPRRTVLSSAAAVTGAGRLSGFLDGLDASRRQDPHLSLLGHSYGSLTAALALRGPDTTGVDEMVAMGSPGLGVETVAGVSVPPQHLFVAEAPDDLVADLGVFGADPSGIDGVRTMPTDGRGLAQNHGHSEYLDEGTATQHGVALVVAGRGDELDG